MNAEELNALLVKVGACKEAVEYAQGKSLRQAWAKCRRADWMLWLCEQMRLADTPGGCSCGLRLRRNCQASMAEGR